ncbi:beta-1,6-N-acetylglucosaminyltransferase [Neobacillus sp. NRS-1170]|uniref:beta-1,6-N-acetylglucosaminyltransferase n=1 Tax=Neobacillus sp. NRS-1170 TaxID=3233898 RepID=UPI003D28DB39
MISIPSTAFILQVHKNPEQVNLFINQLIHEKLADVYVHIDQKSYKYMYNKIVKSPNVKILENCINCEWGDISQVDTTILLLKEVLASKKNYDFICLRSGQDLLVKEGFKEFLDENRNSVFLDIRNISYKNLGAMKINWPKVTIRRYNNMHPYRIYRRILQDLYRKGINLFPNTKYWPEDFKFYCGSQWFNIPLNVAAYIIDFLNENKWYYKYFENTLIPDEWFFHTIIMNSHFQSEVVSNNLVYLRMGETLSETNSPVCLTTKDISFIEDSNQFFARKFDETTDNNVIKYFTNKVKLGSRTLVGS